ncbi:predicted protein [Chaetomium globosum CBS 148.51]|uniref:Uncharacterized protein n=1 Tax=Chaetomium globosum (strain ATCC 6205 / CBS 148.51 / DSM 1962 / NBRC 6347 / NRRL 1970) TaxID=306901 RepID=Q2HBA9_CHAGB|nr:uncharacterized protein CHGG_02495 [Chaetomium globosum CBS 148.51]EAQ90560.1 predicted protein [Chaetomium globosum CBS 148.51]
MPKPRHLRRRSPITLPLDNLFPLGDALWNSGLTHRFIDWPPSETEARLRIVRPEGQPESDGEEQANTGQPAPMRFDCLSHRRGARYDATAYMPYDASGGGLQQYNKTTHLGNAKDPRHVEFRYLPPTRAWRRPKTPSLTLQAAVFPDLTSRRRDLYPHSRDPFFGSRPSLTRPVDTMSLSTKQLLAAICSTFPISTMLEPFGGTGVKIKVTTMSRGKVKKTDTAAPTSRNSAVAKTATIPITRAIERAT